MRTILGVGTTSFDPEVFKKMICPKCGAKLIEEKWDCGCVIVKYINKKCYFKDTKTLHAGFRIGV